MGQQIRFFKKNFMDLDYSNASITVTDSVATNTGQAIVNFTRNRKNTDGWATTGSSDAALTELIFDFGQSRDIDSILIANHNLKSIAIKYWNGSSYVDFSPIISPGSLSDSDYFAQFNSVDTQRLQLVIFGTQTPDDDKFISQFIATSALGQLEGWPIIKKPVISKNKKVTKMLSGKVSVVETVGNFEVQLSIKVSSSENDLSIFEQMYDSQFGTLVWLSGGDTDQFKTVRQGYRKQDIYLMKPVDEYSPEWYRGLYTSGTVVKMDLKESVR